MFSLPPRRIQLSTTSWLTCWCWECTRTTRWRTKWIKVSLFISSLCFFGSLKSDWIRASSLPFIFRLLISWTRLNGNKSILFYSVMMSSCFLLLCGLTFQPVTPVSLSDRRILHVVGVACVLGFTASFAPLSGSSSQQEFIPSNFKSRSLLWTADDSGIRVGLVYYLIRDQNKVLSPLSNVFFILPIASDFHLQRDYRFFHRLCVLYALPLLQSPSDIH